MDLARDIHLLIEGDVCPIFEDDILRIDADILLLAIHDFDHPGLRAELGDGIAVIDGERQGMGPNAGGSGEGLGDVAEVIAE